MTRIWWGCSRIQPFWIKVLDQIYCITGVKIDKDPVPLLLFMILLPAYVLKRGLVSFLSVAVKNVIPRLWKSPQTPAITDWVKEVVFLQQME